MIDLTEQVRAEFEEVSRFGERMEDAMWAWSIWRQREEGPKKLPVPSVATPEYFRAKSKEYMRKKRLDPVWRKAQAAKKKAAYAAKRKTV